MYIYAHTYMAEIVRVESTAAHSGARSDFTCVSE